MRSLILPLAAALTLLAGDALAHAHLASSDPADGAVLRREPERLRLTFTERLRLPGSGVELAYPDGRKLALPLAKDPRDDFVVAASLPQGLPPGRYRVFWRALSPNAHRTQGALSFSIGR